MYMGLATQPDISFSVTTLCQYNSHPFTSHQTADKEFSSITNWPPTFDCILPAAAALAVMINSLATQTQIGPMRVPTTNLKVVISSFSATALSHGNHKSKCALLCQLSKPNPSPAMKAPVKQNGCSSCTKIHTAKTHYHSRSIVTIRTPLVISQLESSQLARSISMFAMIIVKISMPTR